MMSSIQHKRLLPYLIPALLILTVVLFFASLAIGAVKIPFADVFKALGDPSSSDYIIIVHLRLPRAAACILVGAALACSGLILQTMLNNSLASPGIIGINSGAGLAVVMFSVWFSGSLVGQTIGTFLGAFLSAMLIYAIGRFSGASRNKLILAGIAISRLFAALIDAIVLLNPDVMSDRIAFQLGTLSKISLTSLSFGGPVIIIGLIGALLMSKNLGVLSLGDEVATSLGMNVKLYRFFCLFFVALLSGGAVSMCGLLSFLGLIAPHIVRRIVGVSNYFRLTILTALFGSFLTLLCDLIARTVAAPFELPVGIIMAILGVPFFLFLIFDKGGRRLAAN